MQRLEGVVDLNRYSNTDELKRYALFFDKLHVIEADILHASFLAGESYILGDVERTQVELRYLWEKEFVKYTSPYNYLNIFQHTKAPDGTDYFDEFFDSSIDFSKIQQKRYQQPSSHGSAHMRTQANLVKMRDKLSDTYTRVSSAGLSVTNRDIDFVPICIRSPMTETFEGIEQKRVVLEVALKQFPAIGPTNAWQDILDFKQEMRDKQWHLRRFLNSLATKKQTKAEIHDDLEWTLNEYTKAIKIHELKAGTGFVEVYVVPLIEFVEDLAKLNWSKIAKGVLSVKKRQAELMEAEMKAPGRECAYIFEAQRKFGLPR